MGPVKLFARKFAADGPTDILDCLDRERLVTNRPEPVAQVTMARLGRFEHSGLAITLRLRLAPRLSASPSKHAHTLRRN